MASGGGILLSSETSMNGEPPKWLFLFVPTIRTAGVPDSVRAGGSFIGPRQLPLFLFGGKVMKMNITEKEFCVKKGLCEGCRQNDTEVALYRFICRGCITELQETETRRNHEAYWEDKRRKAEEIRKLCNRIEKVRSHISGNYDRCIQILKDEGVEDPEDVLWRLGRYDVPWSMWGL
jgi:hypothetical protein